MKSSEAQALARELLDAHALSEWRFRWDRGLRRFGACHFDDHIISLSRRLTELNDETAVRDVILHEIAHALAGPRAGHGRRWQHIAAQLGVRPRRGADALRLAVPLPRFVGTCPSCDAEVRRHRRDATACKRCCDQYNDGRFTRRFLLSWSVAEDLEDVIAS